MLSSNTKKEILTIVLFILCISIFVLYKTYYSHQFTFQNNGQGILTVQKIEKLDIPFRNYYEMNYKYHPTHYPINKILKQNNIVHMLSMEVYSNKQKIDLLKQKIEEIKLKQFWASSSKSMTIVDDYIFESVNNNRSPQFLIDSLNKELNNLINKQ